MKEKILYVETVSHEALCLTEDIARLNLAKKLINDISMTGRIMPDDERIDTDQQYKIINLIKDCERKLSSALRYYYLQPKGKNVYNSLRKRLKDELKKEGYKFDENI